MPKFKDLSLVSGRIFPKSAKEGRINKNKIKEMYCIPYCPHKYNCVTQGFAPFGMEIYKCINTKSVQFTCHRRGGKINDWGDRVVRFDIKFKDLRERGHSL